MATAIPSNTARFTLRELAEVTGGVLSPGSGEGAEVAGVVTDSRAVVEGCAFVALRGDSFDGHDFIGRAIELGARALVVGRGRGPSGAAVAVIEVDDTLVAFGLVAHAHLRRWRDRGNGARRLAAITGSAGKTTTKELTAAILGGVGPCHATRGNLNNRIGVPSVALAITDETYAVLELGMSVPGEISALRRIAHPDVAALLNVGVAHASSFDGSREAVAREKGAIFEGLVSPRVAVFNVDDDLASAQLARCPDAVRVGFGSSPSADVRLVHRDPLGPFASRVTVARAGESHDVRLPAPGEPAALDLAAAIAIADATYGAPIPWTVIDETIGAWQPAPGRSVPRTLAGDVLVLDDSYNANPASMRAALATLEDLRKGRSGRAIAVLGEMLELGEIAAREHDGVCRELAERHVDVAIGCGGMINEAMNRAKPSSVTLRAMAGPEEAGAFLVDEVRGGDVVLFKGSRGAAVERALAVLVARRPPITHSGTEGP